MKAKDLFISPQKVLKPDMMLKEAVNLMRAEAAATFFRHKQLQGGPYL